MTQIRAGHEGYLIVQQTGVRSHNDRETREHSNRLLLRVCVGQI